MKISLEYTDGQKSRHEGTKFHSEDQVLHAVQLLVTDPVCLIRKLHPFRQTQFILTGLKRYLLLAFDEKGAFRGRTLTLGTHPGPFSVLSSHEWHLLIPFDEILKEADIANIILPKKPNP